MSASLRAASRRPHLPPLAPLDPPTDAPAGAIPPAPAVAPRPEPATGRAEAAPVAAPSGDLAPLLREIVSTAPVPPPPAPASDPKAPASCSRPRDERSEGARPSRAPARRRPLLLVAGVVGLAAVGLLGAFGVRAVGARVAGAAPAAAPAAGGSNVDAFLAGIPAGEAVIA